MVRQSEGFVAVWLLDRSVNWKVDGGTEGWPIVGTEIVKYGRKV